MDEFMPSHKFQVFIGKDRYGFSRVSNLAEEMEYDSVAEGGRNWSPLFFRKAPGKRGTLVLEHGVRKKASGADSLSLKTGTVLKDFLVYVNEKAAGAWAFSFDEGVVTKLDFGELDALKGGILIEKMEIAHSGLVRVGR